MTQVHLLLGGNLGDRKKILQNAKIALTNSIGNCLNESSFYETAAWGKEDQSAFLNQVLLFSTELTPNQVLKTILQIETDLGRVRFEKWGERIIDIDVLFMEDTMIDTAKLKIPHPHIQDRRFTLIPLIEVSPNMIHPRLHKTLKQLLIDCTDQLEVKKIDK